MSERVFEGLDGQVRERTKTMLMYFIVFAVCCSRDSPLPTS